MDEYRRALRQALGKADDRPTPPRAACFRPEERPSMLDPNWVHDAERGARFVAQRIADWIGTSGITGIAVIDDRVIGFRSDANAHEPLPPQAEVLEVHTPRAKRLVFELIRTAEFNLLTEREAKRRAATS